MPSRLLGITNHTTSVVSQGTELQSSHKTNKEEGLGEVTLIWLHTQSPSLLPSCSPSHFLPFSLNNMLCPGQRHPLLQGPVNGHPLYWTLNPLSLS